MTFCFGVFHTDNQRDFQNRALGSLLHMIQDSYAKGHAVRVGWEDGSNAGAIMYFQDYQAQNSKHHEHHDTHESGDVNEGNIFDIPGSKMAYQRSKEILEMVVKKCPWLSHGLKENSQCSQSVRSFLDDQVFALDTNTSLEGKRTQSHQDLTKPLPTNVDPYSVNGPGGSGP